jgi:hypothetical protein
MDQLHLPPDLYRDVRDHPNAGVSAWLCELARLGRWAKKQPWAGSHENSSTERKAFHEISQSDRR